MKTQVLSLEEELIVAADLLKRGEVVAFPTETVYGLGADIFNEEAIGKIFALKKRPSDNPLIAHISSFEQLPLIAKEIPFDFYLLAEAFFPGPLTINLKKQPQVPSLVTGGHETIAVRMPSHPIANALISLAGTPLVAPSANLSGKPSSTKLQHVLDDFEGKLQAVVDGGTSSLGIESTVISLVNKERPILLRPGVVTQKQLEFVLGHKIEVFSKENMSQEKPFSPGIKYRHYAPNAPLYIYSSLREVKKHLAKNPHKKHLLLSSQTPFLNCAHAELSTKNLYTSLRYADSHQFDEILVLCTTEDKKNTALINRLLRASEK